MLLYHSVNFNFIYYFTFLTFYLKDNFEVFNILIINKVEAYKIHSFGMQFSPVNFRRRITRLVSYYALFE